MQARAVTMPAAARDPNDLYLRCLACALVGYAVFGKGFAVLGVAPLYVGELTLGLGLLALMRTRCWFAMLATPTSLLLAVLIVWVLVRTVPFIGAYGVDAVRDSVIVVYGLFAFVVVALLLEKPARLGWILRAYAGFAFLYGLIGGFLFATTVTMADSLRIPGTQIQLPYVRAGEAAFHLGGAAVFVLLGLRRVNALWCFVLCINMAVVTVSRAATLACLVPILLGVVLGRQFRRFAPAALIGLSLLAGAALADLRVMMPGDREVGAMQIVEGISSVFGASEAANFEGTKEFRLRWWRTIRDYTLHGPYFWSGKGFGVNLAMEDGYHHFVTQEATLRSPHNGHMTVLARAGVPGLALWIALLGAWFGMLLHSLLLARQAGHGRWAAVFVWITCYGAGILVNASFDVALEGPMSGIWFWSVVGLGIGASMIYRAGLVDAIGDPA
ncbi:O-antigen ligase family protein [Methylobacterium radiodurans]|nr:O-antigen ligase family protein [Methylobacterium radiodurans]